MDGSEQQVSCSSCFASNVYMNIKLLSGTQEPFLGHTAAVCKKQSCNGRPLQGKGNVAAYPILEAHSIREMYRCASRKMLYLNKMQLQQGVFLF